MEHEVELHPERKIPGFNSAYPLYIKPEIGKNPFSPLEGSRPDRTADGLRQLMTDIASAFDEVSSTHVSISNVMSHSKMRRLVIDRYLNDAKKNGLILQDIIGGITITDAGHQYLVEHKILEL